MSTNGLLFANYDLKTSSALSSPSRRPARQVPLDWKLKSDPSSSSQAVLDSLNTPQRPDTPSKGTGNIKSLFNTPSPSSRNTSSLSLSSSVPAWIPPPSPGLVPPPRFQGPLDTSNLGYFAFPTPELESPPPNNSSRSAGSFAQPVSKPEPELSSSPPSTPPLDPSNDKHRARLEREQAEILRGEEDWVRSGGILRDSEGKRDLARTEKIREDLRLREWEEEVTRRWDDYEQRWEQLVKKRNSESEISFDDIPWPVYVGDSKANSGGMSSGSRIMTPAVHKVQLSDLTLENVQQFLTEGLKVRGCKVTQKERIRKSFLLWHPDKMTGMVSKVVESDREDVEAGISAIVRSLQVMNSKH